MSIRSASSLLFVYLGLTCLACVHTSERTLLFTAENKVAAAPKRDTIKFPFDYDPNFIKIFSPDKWMIADSKTVWTTNNGGQAWQKTFEPPDSDARPPNVRGLSSPGENIVFLATDDSLFRSDNFGEKWQRQGAINFSTNGIFFIDNKKGWAVATSFDKPEEEAENTPLYEGAIYSTIDGGISWKKNKIDGVEALARKFDRWSLADIIAFDSGKGFAAGSGIILQTDNFGETWKVTNAESLEYYKIGFLNENFVWALTTGGYREFSLTKDGGNKWQTVSLPETNRETAQFVEFMDEKTVLAGLNNLYLTTTSGKDWSKIENPNYIYYAELEKDGAVIALAKDEKRSFSMRSIDKGKHWTTNWQVPK